MQNSVSYQYYRDTKGSPLVTKCICYGEDKTVIAVGYAYCSPKEKHVVKKLGRNVAKGNALRALFRSKDIPVPVTGKILKAVNELTSLLDQDIEVYKFFARTGTFPKGLVF